MDATPAKWNVFRVICVPGSPILWAHRAPTAVLGSIFALEYFSLQRLRNCFSWALVQRSTHDNTNRKTEVGWLRCFRLPVACFEKQPDLYFVALFVIRARDILSVVSSIVLFSNQRSGYVFLRKGIQIHREAVKFIKQTTSTVTYLSGGYLFQTH